MSAFQSLNRVVNVVGVQRPVVYVEVPIIAAVGRIGSAGSAWIDCAERGERTRIVEPFEGQCKVFEPHNLFVGEFSNSELFRIVPAEVRAQSWYRSAVPDSTQRVDKGSGKPKVEALAVVFQSRAQNRYRATIANLTQFYDDSAEGAFQFGVGKSSNSPFVDESILTSMLVE